MALDIYTVPRVKFGCDSFDCFVTWFAYHVGFCAKGTCGGEEKDCNAKRNAAWMYKLCGFPKQSTVSGMEGWMKLPSDDLM